MISPLCFTNRQQDTVVTVGIPPAKLVDKIRTDWSFSGTLVKYKLEVGATDAELLSIAERSRQVSDADFIVANTLEGMHEWAYLGSADKGYVHVVRSKLAERLIGNV